MRKHRVSDTFTMVLLCRMKVWKPNQRSFMHNSNATMTKASSSNVAWTCRAITRLLQDTVCLGKCKQACVHMATYVDI